MNMYVFVTDVQGCNALTKQMFNYSSDCKNSFQLNPLTLSFIHGSYIVISFPHKLGNVQA